MILEIEDITERKSAFGHANFPQGKTLGEAIGANPRAQAVMDAVVQCVYNGSRVDDWKNLRPGKSDRVKLFLAPTEPVTAFIAGFATLGAVGTSGAIAGTLAGAAFQIGAIAGLASLAYSIVSFVVSLFNQPSMPSPTTGKGQSPTYGFDGIQTTVTPGGVVPVIIGQHITGGQLLAMTVDVKSAGRLQQMSLLLGLCEGPITSVNCIRINNIALESIGSVTAEVRLGTSSQGIISGFETIRNTFQDGREVESGSPLTYSTNGNSVAAVELVFGALDGLVKFNKDGTRSAVWLDYSIEQRLTGTTTYTIVTSPQRWKDKTAASVWSTYVTTFSPAGGYDIRVALVDVSHAAQLEQGTTTKGRFWLTHVTERQGAGEPYSGTALLAIKGAATAQFHGSRPNVTALVRGRTVSVYSTTAVSTVTFSQIPAWGILDYMTNSVYGMGAYIAPAAVDIQSFIDFATLCQSQVANGRGGLEDQHHLDIVMDQKRSHWQWLQDILGNYRSSLIFSQDKFKIITDRQDLPVRQVFHAGNIVPGTTEIRIASDPTRPNQANVRFANQDLDYEQDPIFVQDSASVFGAGDPIKDYDMNLLGVVRESEAIRTAAFDLNRRRQQRREMTFSTGLEAIAVEPGDMCRAGVLFTDYEAGYGGRAVDGSSNHIVLDREFVVKSGYPYDLFVWHTEADTVEQRTVATSLPSGISSFATITVSPTSGFSYEVKPNDRWAIGVSSEDLFLAFTKRVSRDEMGRHRITVEEYRTVTPTTPQPRQLLANQQATVTAGPPAQPMAVAIREDRIEMKDGTIASRVVIDVTPSMRTEGGRITVPGTIDSVTLAQSHNPNNDALTGERLTFQSGPASGAVLQITRWNGSTSVASVYPAFLAAAASGDPYNLEKKGGEFAGFDLQQIHNVGSGEEFSHFGTYYGTIADIPINPQLDNSQVFRVIPFSRLGTRNEIGSWVVSLTTYGDTVPPPQPSSISAIQGTGKDVTVRVYPTSYADLWGHEFFRHTANCFTAATSIGFHSELYHDTNIEFETTYNYWARPRDFSFNVGSWIGPVTFVASRIMTTDIASQAVSIITEFFNNALVDNIDNTETAVGSLIVSVTGGAILIVAKADQFEITNGGIAVFALRADSLGGTLLGQAIIDAPGNITGTLGGTSVITRLHQPNSGTVTYVITAVNCNTGKVNDIRNRSMQAVELKR